jgi:anti-sigma B factor antagonist
MTVATEADGALCIRLGGDLDIASLPDVESELNRLLTRKPRPLLLDLADLDFLDSSGVALLIRLANRFTPVQTRHATEPVRRVLGVLGLADRFGLDGA